MNKSIKATIGLTLLTALFVVCTSLASMQDRQTMNAARNTDATTIGNMSREEFDRRNRKGAAAVAAVTATSAPLSKGDQKLMMDVVMGGMMQLEISRAALDKVSNDEAKTLAQSEVEEQIGLSAKLKEIAAAKNITLPTAPDAKTQSMVAKMQGMTAGANFDRNYVKESGVKGHEKLDKVMTKVESSAADSTLKSLAAAAHPLVLTHLQVSRDVLAKMSGKGMMNGNSSNGNMMQMNSNSNSRMNRNSNSMMNSNSMNSNSMMNDNSNSMMNNSNSNSMNRNSRTNRNSNSTNRHSNSNSNSNMNMNSNSNSNSNRP